MTFPVSNRVYTQGQGSVSTALFITILADRDPTVSDVNYPITKRWVNTTTGIEFILEGFTIVNSVVEAVWDNLSNPSGTILSLGVDTSSPPGTDPVLPTTGGLVSITGAQVASGVVGANVIRTDSLQANQFTIEIQRTGSAASANSTLNGVAHFDSTEFTVDSDGFVSLLGGGTAIDSFTVPFGTSPVVPDGAGNINLPAGNGFAFTGGTNAMTGNMVSPFTGTFGFTDASSGGTQTVYVENTSNTASSNADFSMIAGGTSGGDPYAHWVIPATIFYALGIDNSDGDKWKLTGDVSPVSPSTGTTIFSFDPSGLIFTFTNPVAAPSYKLNGSSTGVISILPQANAGTYNFNMPITAGTAGYFLTSQGGGSTAMTWTDPTGIISIGAFGSTPNANGLTLTSNVLNMEPADGTHPGGVSITSQSFGGAKVFTISASSPVFGVLGTGGGIVQVQYLGSATNYNFNLPSTAGTTGQVLTSAGGVAASMTWTTLSGVAVTSITGTANQVFANGTSGTPQTGAIILTLPQNIALTSSVQFGQMGLGVANFNNTMLHIGGNALAAQPGEQGIFNDQVITSATTSAYYANNTSLSTQAAAFAITNIFHYNAAFAGIGAGSSVTSQFGFFADSTLVGATSNYGFFGGIPAAAGRWNLYMDGSALNYMNGAVGIGTNAPLSKLDVSGNVAIGSYAGTAAAPTGGLIMPGFLGINLTSPMFQLHISGVGTGASGFLIDGSSTGVPNAGTQQGVYGSVRGFTVGSDGNTLSSAPTIGVGIAINRGGVALGVSNPSGTAIMVESGLSMFGSASTPLSRIDINGNLAVGTYAATAAAPANGMIVSGPVGLGRSTQQGSFQLSIGNEGIYVQSSTTPQYQGFNAAGTLGTRIDGNAIYSDTSSTSLELKLGAQTAANTYTEIMRLTPSGFVGIGTTAPHSLLQFPSLLTRRVITLYEVANNDHEYLGFGVQTGTFVYQAPDATTDHVFFAAASSSTSTELMRIRANTANPRVSIAGGISTAPVSSNTATAAFGSLVLTTPRQNTTGYDILVTVQIFVTSATTATIVAGAGSSATPTTDTIFPSFTVAAFTPFSFSMIVPNNYYMTVDTTGTIVVASTTTVSSPL